tara:strand:- start:665 stop:1105 length:441 start_codon:yes stop_codon:yes gene_type:complete
MAYTYKDAIYIDDTGNRIDCWLDLEKYEGWTPYTLDVNDADMTIDNTVLLAQMQEANDIAPYVAPTLPTEEELAIVSAEKIRTKRAGILSSLVDPVISNPMRWDALTSTQQNEVTTYRTALLDITDQDTFPTSVTWPTIPSVLELA